MPKAPRTPKVRTPLQDDEPHNGKDFSDCKKWLDHA
jgi:hypothetical protein